MKKNKKPQNKLAPPKKTQLNNWMLLWVDLISLLFSLMPSLLAFSVMGLFIYYSFNKSWLVLLLAPVVLLMTFILTIAIVRFCLPALKPGRYKRELNKAMLTWYCHFALSRAAKITGLIHLIQSFHITKFFYWRALGAKVSFNILNAFDIDWVDYPLITIGKGVTLGSQVSISCHSDTGNYLQLAPVILEENVFIGMSTTLGPGTHVKRGAWIGYGNVLINQVVYFLI